jgi:hypothetical protein
MAQNIGIVAILIAGGDHQYAEADNVLERMHHLRGLARIGNVRCQAGRDAAALLDFAQCQQTATGGEALASKAAMIGLSATGDRPGSGAVVSTEAAMVLRSSAGLASAPKSYVGPLDCVRPADHRA